MVSESIIKGTYSYYLPLAYTEEADDALLALADLLYCREETDDNMLDIIFGLDDDIVHQFADTQVVNDEEGQVRDNP